MALINNIKPNKGAALVVNVNNSINRINQILLDNIYIYQYLNIKVDGNVTIDLALGNIVYMVVDAPSGGIDVTLKNYKAGKTYYIIFDQGSAAYDQIINWFPTNLILWENGIEYTYLIAGENTKDLIKLYYNGTDFYGSFNNSFE